MTESRTRGQFHFSLRAARVSGPSNLSDCKKACAVFLLCAATAIACSAQTLTTLFSFDGSANGANPGDMILVQGLDGDFYGTTEEGGSLGGGTVFKISPAGTLTTIYNFCGSSDCTDGIVPRGGLVQATNGHFYGTTLGGGANGKGTIFEVTSEGAEKILYSFCSETNCADGGSPFAGLIQASDGNFYGTTSAGGNNSTSCPSDGCGTVFNVTPTGTLTTLYAFCTQALCADGAEPLAGLVQGTDGNLYGTTSVGGIGFGTIFRVSAKGTVSTLHTFDSSDGAFPEAGLVEAESGFYGTTSEGGAKSSYGTVYKIMAPGTLGAESFDGSHGAFPSAGLVLATDGNLYGTTSAGGGNPQNCKMSPGCGTLFKMGPGRLLTSLYTFCLQTGCPDGFSPAGGLVQGTDGNFYGTTGAGGLGFHGTVFSLSVGLGPFIKTLPISGKVAAPVFILGTNLTGATSVTFNGTPAAFTVVSSSEITTTVPTGATSGTVQVTTPSGTLLSNVAFRVTP
jgi:uncharacterized repeat protein (TIGR03803 family)